METICDKKSVETVLVLSPAWGIVSVPNHGNEALDVTMREIPNNKLRMNRLGKRSLIHIPRPTRR